MRQFPLADPGVPDVRSPARFLFWTASKQRGPLALGAFYAVVWMGAQSLTPAIIGRAIDEGLANQDLRALLWWTSALLAAGLVQTGANLLRHRTAMLNWYMAAYRVVQLVTDKAARVGAPLPRKVATGEVVSVGTADVDRLGEVMYVTARTIGAITSFVVIGAIVLHMSTTLGLIVLIGVPLATTAVGPLLRPLQRRQAVHRARIGELTTLGSDIVAGLRVLRGVGGEQTYSATYRTGSQQVREAGLRAGRVQSIVDASQVLLPGLFVVALVWLGARFAVAGQISVGELVAFYGYAALLSQPLRDSLEAVHHFTRALVAARRTVRVLGLPEDLPDPNQPRSAGVGDLVDPDSGFRVTPGALVAVASTESAQAAELADRLGRYTDSAAALAGVPLRDMAKAEVRHRILVHHTDAELFTGVLRNELDPTGNVDETRFADVLEATSSGDILDALPDGLDTVVEERGRSLSGGQRQRLAVARSLLADPEILVLVEPTSAVDAHTEAHIADRLRKIRANKTTVVMSTSPLVLARVDEVAYLADGVVADIGTHTDLLDRNAEYRALVTRGEDA